MQTDLFAGAENVAAIPGLRYEPAFLSEDEEAHLLAVIRSLPLAAAQSKENLARRRVLSCGGSYAYPYYGGYYGHHYYHHHCDGGAAGAIIGGAAGAAIGYGIERSYSRHGYYYGHSDGTAGAVIGGTAGALIGYGIARNC